MSGWLTGSDPLLRVAAVGAQVSIAGTALLLLCVFWLHWRHRVDAARRAVFLRRWRPWLAAVALGSAPPDTGDMPPLRRTEVRIFLREWIALLEVLDREVRGGLQSVGRQLRVPAIARRLLRRRRLRDRLLAVAALGHVGDAAAWDEILALVHGRNLPLALAAARALVRIDPHRAMEQLMPSIEQREDWPPARVATLLQEAGPDVLAEPLAAAIRRARPEMQARLITHLVHLDEPVATGLIRGLLDAAPDDRVIGKCLDALQSPALLPAVRQLATHPRWHIRMLVAKAIGRLGERSDGPLLGRLLADPHWWVRYRAAQALVALPWMSDQQVRAVAALQTDRYARDALDQALAELAYR